MTTAEMRTIHKEFRKHPLSLWLTGPEFDPRRSNKIIKSIVDKIRGCSAAETKVEIRKTGNRITFAQVTSPDNSINASINYAYSYAPINSHMMKDMVPAEIVLDIHYDPAVNKAYDSLARKL